MKREVDRHRFVTSPSSMRGEPAPEGLGEACPRLGSWPRCCNGCAHRRAYGCSRRPRAFHGARMAQRAAEAELSSARSGIDETEASAAAKLAAIRDGLSRGLSPEQIAATEPGRGLGPAAPAIYRWVDAGHGRPADLDLRRKVGYRRRKGSGRRKGPRHSPSRSHDAFLALGPDACASAWEMDTVEGCEEDSARLPALLHRPTRPRLALPVPDGTCASVLAGLGLLRAALGPEGVRRVLALVLTDNGAEFSDEEALAAALGERAGVTRPSCCDPRRADQKGACERNHVEVRKVLPKGRGLRFDLLSRADLALLMSHADSRPRGCLGWRSPIEAFLGVFGEDGEALPGALGVGAVPAGELDLTPGLIARAREKRGDAPLS